MTLNIIIKKNFYVFSFALSVCLLPSFSLTHSTPHHRCALTVPRVEIVDERGLQTPDKFYKSGSTIELKCVISKIPQPTSYVTWKHGLRMLNYDTSRGGIRYKKRAKGAVLCNIYLKTAVTFIRKCRKRRQVDIFMQFSQC